MGDFEEKNQESENLITDVSSEETSNENYNNDIDVTDAETAVEQYDETGNDVNVNDDVYLKMFSQMSLNHLNLLNQKIILMMIFCRMI